MISKIASFLSSRDIPLQGNVGAMLTDGLEEGTKLILGLMDGNAEGVKEGLDVGPGVGPDVGLDVGPDVGTSTLGPKAGGRADDVG